jgi:hypothetical protein
MLTYLHFMDWKFGSDQICVLILKERTRLPLNPNFRV